MVTHWAGIHAVLQLCLWTFAIFISASIMVLASYYQLHRDVGMLLFVQNRFFTGLPIYFAANLCTGLSHCP